MRHSLPALVLLGLLLPGGLLADSTSGRAVRDSQAVILQEEDILTEISKQGIRLDGGEAGIVRKGAPAPAGDSARVVADSARPAATADSVRPPGGQLPPPSAADGRGGKYSGRYPGKYGPLPSEAASPGTPAAVQSALPADTVPAGPAMVENVRSINFARNLKEYRSPKLAMFLSLLLPGLGQAYARNYWKTVLFGVLEAGIIGVSVAYNVRGDNQMDDAHRYADKHYDPAGTRFPNYYDSLWQYLDGLDPTDTLVNPRMLYNTYALPSGDTMASYVDYYNGQRRKKTDTYYNLIDDMPYAQGWDDCRPTLAQIFNAGPGGTVVIAGDTFQVHGSADTAYLVYQLPDTAHAYYGLSGHQGKYRGKVSTANDSYRTSTNVLFLLIVNHIAAAIDAGITAKRHNDRLLGRQSLWDRIGVEQRMVNTGSQVVPGYALSIKF